MQNFPVSQPRIPTFIGLFVLLVLIGGLVFATLNINKIKSLTSSADVSEAPSKSVEIANISDSSITVFWTTDKQTNGTVSYGQTPSLEKGVAVDERDLQSPNGKYITHFVRLSGLLPQTKYYFKVGSGSNSFGDPTKNQAPYEIITGPRISLSGSVDPIFGQAIDAGGSPLKDAIAIWQSPGASKLAALVKPDANYVLPIATARNVTLSSFLSLNPGTLEKITIEAGSVGSALVNCSIGSDRPIVTVKIGQTLDCDSKAQPPVPSGNSNSTPPPAAAGFKPPVNSGALNQSSGSLNVNITSGQTVSSTLPTISGTAGSKQVVKIEIHSETPYSGAVVAGPDGSWSWTPPSNLSPGQHTVTITVVNADGTTQKITRDFYVAGGSPILPLTSGTPSAQTSHLTCVSNACQTVSGSGSDTCTTDSDCVISPIATPSATPPVTGVTTGTVFLLTLAAGLLTLSMLTIFFVL